MGEETPVKTVVYVRTTSDAETKHRITMMAEYLEDQSIIPLDWANTTAIEKMTRLANENGLVQATPDQRAVRIYADRPDKGYSGQLEKAITYADEHDTVERVITPTVAVLDEDHVQRWIDAGVDVHSISQGMTIRRDAAVTGATSSAIRVLTCETTNAEVLLSGIDHTGGRPPIGCTSSQGQLAPADNYRKVCATLQAVEDGRLSKRAAAQKLDCVPKTIGNALDRPALYQLDRDE